MKEQVITMIDELEARNCSSAWIALVDNYIEFDCSEGEYGPIRIPIEKFHIAYNKHFMNLLNNDLKNRDK
jgi:hypothetical protein